jgi:hypothetical protein
MSVSRFLAASALALALLAPVRAAAVVPDVLPVQGVLSDSFGQLYTGTVNIEFRVYGQQTGGTALWTELRTGVNAVAVDGGLFTVYLGSVSALDIGALILQDELWLAMRVGTDDEMSRVRFGTVLFAWEAQVCRQIGGLQASDIQPMLSGANACPVGQYLRGWNAAMATPVCSPDLTGSSAYTAGSGLALSGTEFSIAPQGIQTSHIQNGAVTRDKIADKILVYQNNTYCEQPGAVTQSTTCQTRICDTSEGYYYNCSGNCYSWTWSPQTCTNTQLGYVISAS